MNDRDRFESEVQKFVDKQNGDDLTPRVVYQMLKAVDGDAVARHAESTERQDAILARLDEHCMEALVRDRRIGLLEDYVEESRRTCAERVKVLINEEHDARHALHMEGFHAADADFRDRLVWFFASSVGKFALVVLGLLAGVLLNLVVYGRP